MTTSWILCDAENCHARLTVAGDLSQAESCEVARRSGWRAQPGASRGYHHCPRCAGLPLELAAGAAGAAGQLGGEPGAAEPEHRTREPTTADEMPLELGAAHGGGVAR